MATWLWPLVWIAAFLVSPATAETPRAGDSHKEIDAEVLTLDPYAAALEPGATLELRGRLKPGYRFAFAAVTRPDGHVEYCEGSEESGRILVAYRLAHGAGRYQMEIVCSGPYGNQVGANIDVRAGDAEPTPERPADGFDADSSPETLALRLFELTNQLRRESGLPVLTWDPTIAAIATEHAQACARLGRLAHVLPEDGGTVADRAARLHGWPTRYGVPGSPRRLRAGGPVLLGDNLALAANADLAYFLLAESPGHRAAMLNPHVEFIGIGAERTQRRVAGGVEVGIYFCMGLAQINDPQILAALDRDRRLAAQEGSGELGIELARARAHLEKKEAAKALLVYRRILSDVAVSDATLAADIEARIAALVAGDPTASAAADALLSRKCKSLLQLARNLVANGKASAAADTVAEILELCPGTVEAEAAAAILDPEAPRK